MIFSSAAAPATNEPPEVEMVELAVWVPELKVALLLPVPAVVPPVFQIAVAPNVHCAYDLLIINNESNKTGISL